MAQSTDRIEKQTVLRAPIARVWDAISDAQKFGTWFGVDFGGTSFAAGVRMVGKITPTKADPEVAKKQQPHEGKKFEIIVDRIEPPRLFSFRWHPFAIDPSVDYSSEPATLVEMMLAEVPEGTRLTIRESGFDGVPLARRAAAFSANEGGWEAQLTLIAKYLAHVS